MARPLFVPLPIRVCVLTGGLLAWAALARPATVQGPATPRDALRQAILRGEQAQREGNPKLAFEVFEKAVPEAERLQDRELLARSLAGFGWSQWATGQYIEALDTRARAHDLFRALGDRRGESAVLRGLGETYYSLGRYDEALKEYGRSLDRAPDARERGLTLSDLGICYRALGRLDAAREALQRSVAELRSIDDHARLAQPLTFLGIVSRAQGDYARALEFYDAALAAARAAKNQRLESQILGNAGNVYLDLGRYDRAIESYGQSLTIAERIEYVAQVGFNHQNIAATLNIVGRPADALPHFERALEIWRRLERRPQIGWTLVNLGVLQREQRDGVPAARRSFEEALAIGREIQEVDLQAHALLDLGDTDDKDRRWQDALARYEEALGLGRSDDNPDVEYQALAGRGMALHRLGRTSEAIADLKASAAIIRDLRKNVESDQSKIAFLDTRQGVFHDLAVVLTDAGRPAEALEAAEAVRARATADLLQDRQLRMRPEDGPAFTGLRTAVAEGATAEDVEAALSALRGRDGELASLVAAESLDTDEARAIAARLNATIVEYLVTDRTLLAFVLDRDRIRVRRIEVSSAALAGAVSDLLNQIARPLADDLRHPEGLAPILREMHRLILEPIADWLPDDPASRLVIVPHGPLLLLPFAPLTDAAGRPLVERHTLISAPALSIFRYTAARHPAERGALIVADPVPPADSGLERLPGSRAEARSVSRWIPSADARLLAGSAASESNVKKALGSQRIIHLATHGLVSEQRPLASSLVLGAGDGEDGYLRADEVFGLRLQADLVVLSGCSTGRGRLSAEGMLGLTRSFLYAGTPSLLVSYWDISDAATVHLMDRFYEGLSEGLDKAAALRAAQLDTRQRYPHPALWAAFVLIGEA